MGSISRREDSPLGMSKITATMKKRKPLMTSSEAESGKVCGNEAYVVNILYQVLYMTNDRSRDISWLPLFD